MVRAQPAPPQNLTNLYPFRETGVNSKTINKQRIDYAIEKLNLETPLPLEYNEHVEQYIELFLTLRRKDLSLALGRAGYHFPLIEQLLDKHDLPLELKYLAVVESGLNPLAKSPSGAVGLWQFLYNTCSLFDLKVTSYIDERRDPYKSTEAACAYFSYLYQTYHDWNLVMAGYNGGPGEVRKAIERSGGKTDYWELRPFLSQQAQDYVPAFIAITYLMTYYADYGIQPVKPDGCFDDLDTLMLDYAVSFQQIAAVLPLSVSELEVLNPQYKRQFIPDCRKLCTLVLPAGLIVPYIKAEQQILSYQIPPINYHVLCMNAGVTKNRIPVTHTVEKGEFFHKIAMHYNCTIENLKAWNGMQSTSLYPGQKLTIWIEQEP
jgi:membrane-bound lytic murein transglycosylase D